MRAGGGPETRRAEQILDAERQTFQRTALAFGQSLIRRTRHLAGVLGRFQYEGVERIRCIDGRQMCLGKFGGGKFLLAQRITRLR